MHKVLAGAGIDLKPTVKTYSVEQDKTRSPEQTVEWVRGRFAGLGAQVLQKTIRIDTGRLDVPVYISLYTPEASRLTNTQKQMGKGASPAQAEASALMELAERYSFFSFMRNTEFPLLTADQVPGPVMDFSQAAKSVYHPADDLERARAVYDLLPQTWTRAYNLSLGREESISLGWFYAINEYNGPAAGNCPEEAVMQSLCEVVERHISALVTLESRPTPAIDPASVRDPVAAELIAKFKRAGVEVYLKDFTCGMGIPSVAALCYDPATFPEKSEIVYAAGTASDPAKALIRALTEVAQLAGDFQLGTSYMVSALPKFGSLDEAEYVTRAQGTVSLDSLPSVCQEDIYAEVQACVSALRQRDFSVYTLNVTHGDLQVPAVYTIIPGAHFAQRTSGTDVIFHAAKMASQLEDPNLAQEVLGRMARVAGESYYLPFFQALALINLQEPQMALEALDRALALNPPAQDEASIHTQRGAALKDLGRYAEAIESLQEAAKQPEPHHEIFNLMGFCHFMLKQHEESIEAFSRAIEIEPGAAINYANIGSNLRDLGQTAEACRMYEQALELDPGLEFARVNLEKLKKLL